MPPSKEFLITNYFKKGKACIYGAKLLSKKTKAKGTEEILLIHGVELLLSVFLLLEDKSIKRTRDVYNKYGHDYFKIYQRCKEIDKQGVLETFDSLGEYLHSSERGYFKNSIEARFPDNPKLHTLPPSFYSVIDKKLIPKLEELMSFKFDLENFSPTVDENLEWQQERYK